MLTVKVYHWERRQVNISQGERHIRKSPDSVVLSPWSQGSVAFPHLCVTNPVKHAELGGGGGVP